MLRGWLELVRLPNLITAPGDPIAGFLLASISVVPVFPGILWVALASLFFYTGGMIFNDVADRELDAIERPTRPLPAGKMSVNGARLVGGVLFALGLVFCAMVGSQTFWLGACLCALIQTYNVFVKEIPFIGALVMGACRGLSVLLGASAARETASMGSRAWAAALIIAGFVASITHLSRRETGPIPPTAEAWIPLGVLAMGLTLLTTQFEAVDHLRRLGLILPYIAACALAFYVAMKVTNKGHYEDIGLEIQEQEELMKELPSLVGVLISGLLFLQAGFIFASGKGLWAIGFGGLAVVGWTLNKTLRRHFYAS